MGWQWKGDDLAKWESRLRAGVTRAVEQTAKEAAQVVHDKAPKDTGALKASIYVGTADSSDYAQATAEALNAAGRKVMEQFEPEALVTFEPGEIQAVVAVAMKYGTFLEYGFFNVRANRQIAPQPFFIPGIESQRLPFEARLQKELDKL